MRKKRTPAAEARFRTRTLKARGGHSRMTGSKCIFCGGDIPEAETARTTETPPGQVPLPPGCAWVVCGENCPELPQGAQVFYRVPIDQRR
jgi:hypothetical protein